MNLKHWTAESGKQPCRPALEFQLPNASGQTCGPLTRELISWFRFSFFRDSYAVNHESTKDDNTKKKLGRTSGLAGLFASCWLRRHFPTKSLLPVEMSCF